MLVRNEFVLNVGNSDFEDMGYNLKRDGWLNSFADSKNQSMREDWVAWRGARENRPEFFSIFFSALTDKDDIIVDLQCGLGWFFFSLFLMILFFIVLLIFLLVLFPIHSFMLTFSHFVLLGGSIIACRSIQCHIVALESDIDIFKSILLPMRETEQEHTSQHAAPQRGSVFAPPPRKMAKRNFDLLCA